jgi:hypothetical protein
VSRASRKEATPWYTFVSSSGLSSGFPRVPSAFELKSGPSSETYHHAPRSIVSASFNQTVASALRRQRLSGLRLGKGVQREMTPSVARSER